MRRGQGSWLSLLLRQRIRTRWHKSVAYIKIAVSRESYCLVPSRLPASLLLKRGPGWNSSGLNSTSSKKERNLYKFLKDQVMHYHITFYCPFRALLRHLLFFSKHFLTKLAFCATFAFLDTTTQKKQTFSSGGEKPVTVERAILFSQSLKVAF